MARTAVRLKKLSARISVNIPPTVMTLEGREVRVRSVFVYASNMGKAGWIANKVSVSAAEAMTRGSGWRQSYYEHPVPESDMSPTIRLSVSRALEAVTKDSSKPVKARKLRNR